MRYWLLLLVWFSGWLSVLWAQGEPAQPTIGVVTTVDAGNLSEQLSTLKAKGVDTLAVALQELPSDTEWNQLVEALESSGLGWWLYLRGLPRAEGWICAPERYRMQGNVEGVYSVHLNGVERVMVAVSPSDTPNLRTLTQITLSEGRALYAQGETENSVLLFYPLSPRALPDLWEGWDQYRDRLIHLLQVRRPKVGFRGWMIESGWDSLSIAGFPTSVLARTEWEGFLRTRYPHIIELERAWDVSGGIGSYTDASKMVPLWREGRGLPFLVASDDLSKPQEVDPRKCQFWNDYHAFLAERWNTLLNSLRVALQTATPESAFLLIHSANEPTELDLPPAFAFPQVPNGVRLTNAWRPLWGSLMTVAVANAETQVYPVRAVILEGIGDDMERASLLLARARSVGIREIFWEIQPNSLEGWSTLKNTDSAPERPQFLRFPKALWGTTTVQKYPAGWWVPDETMQDLRPLLWGFDVVGFWRLVDVQSVDKSGNTTVSKIVELTLWSPSEEQELLLRRTDRNPLEAFDLNGNPVRLDIKGDTVRLRVEKVPVRIRGFASVPLCENCVEQWLKRTQDLLKRPDPAGQDPNVLRFNLQGAIEVYRKDRTLGFDSIRSAWFETERAYMPYRWFEAESARLHAFGTIRRDSSASAGATLWLSSPFAGSFYAQYPLTLRTDGSYTLWLAVRLHANRELGKVRWQIFQESAGEGPIAQGEGMLIPERAQGIYADLFGWFAVGSVSLKAGDYRLRLEWIPAGTKPPFTIEWDVVLVSPVGIQPQDNRFPRY